jgi:hypothetical protein
MPVVDELAARPSTRDVVLAARTARAVALRGWMSVAWRMLCGERHRGPLLTKRT